MSLKNLFNIYNSINNFYFEIIFEIDSILFFKCAYSLMSLSLNF